MDTHTPLTESPDAAQPTYINFFRPASEGMRAEVRLIGGIIITWAVMIYIMPVLLILFKENPEGASILTRTKFIGFPFHYWYATQFCTIMFVAMCAFFSRQIDKIYAKYR